MTEDRSTSTAGRSRPLPAKEAVEILIHNPGAALAWDKALDAIVSAERRQRDSVWAMVANAFAALADPGVLDAVSPGPDETFDTAVFLHEHGTLYLLGTASGASATAGLVAALIEDVVDVARRLAARSTGARLDPPLGLILDEAANYPLPSLGALMSEGGGTGSPPWPLLQSLAQPDTAGAVNRPRESGTPPSVKIVLGGSSNADDLNDIARLVGDRTERKFSQTAQSGGRKVGDLDVEPGAGGFSTPRRHSGDHSGPRAALVAFGATDHAHAAPVDGAPRCGSGTTRPGFDRRCRSKRSRTRMARTMRSPRPGLAWSMSRIHRRAAYCNYMASRAMVALRERWVAGTRVEDHGNQPHCLVCGAEWALCDDLHHRTYERLGREACADLIPLAGAVMAPCTGSSRPIDRGAGLTERRPRI